MEILIVLLASVFPRHCCYSRFARSNKKKHEDLDQESAYFWIKNFRSIMRRNNSEIRDQICVRTKSFGYIALSNEPENHNLTQ
jgi:hypothetical protein